MASPKDNQLTLDYWTNRWTNSLTAFHEPHGNAALNSQISSVLKRVYGDQAPTALKVLVPLCGKTQDMLMFYKLGYHVIGTEYAQVAIDEFFAENDLEKCPNVEDPFNMTTDKRLILVKGDHFESVSKNMPFPLFDIVWDRGSFEALNLKDRDRYAKQMMPLLKPGTGVYLLKTVQYDTSEYGGPPLAVSLGEVERYFSDMTVEPLVTRDLFQPGASELRFKEKGVTKMTETLFLLQLKSEGEKVPEHLDHYMSKENETKLDDWNDWWIKGQTGWHEAAGNAGLKEHLPAILNRVHGDQVPSSLKVLLPLCGKTPDLLLFYNLGYSVVGTEYVQAAIDEFFTDNNLSQSLEATTPLTMTNDRRLILIQGDHFQSVQKSLPFLTFDIIWDRGAFGAVNLTDRNRYAKQMMPLLKPQTGIYLLETTQYDTSEYGGPPFSATQDQIQECFSNLTVEPLETKDVLKSSFAPVFMDLGVTKMDQTIFLLQSK